MSRERSQRDRERTLMGYLTIIFSSYVPIPGERMLFLPLNKGSIAIQERRETIRGGLKGFVSPCTWRVCT